ncbi:uncharacterized protein LOC142319938 [Lycorma delicatula]|uniref:uncharacterized protein LOC142319938 n=1 Tax=Lycorma delicatula TaxID=130591 RepID=UPI003F514412
MCGTIRSTLHGRVRSDKMMKLYKSIAVPVGLYGSETCLTSSRLQAAEMRFLRAIIRITRKDKVRNDEVRQQLNIFNLNGKIIENRNNWKQHVDQMDNCRFPKKIMQYRPVEYRNIGKDWKKIYFKFSTGQRSKA